MLARSKLNSTESKISEALRNNELAVKTLWQFLMKKRNIDNWKKVLEWWIVKKVMLKNLVSLRKVKNRY